MKASILNQIIIEALETEDEFIFTTIRPWCEEKIQRKISKKDLELALTQYFNKKEEGTYGGKTKS